MQGQDSWKNNNGQPDTSTKFTPQAIAKEMLDMLDGTESEKYLDKIDLDKNTKILNINCKTGIFLIHAIDKLDKALLERANHGEAGYENFKDSSYRKQYIINNQVYGLTLNDTDALLFQSRNVYGCINHPHIAYIKELYAGLRDINKKKQSESIEKTWIEKVRTEIDKAFKVKSAGSERQEHMDFDIVVGNPPYNDDLYLSFVTLGHAISTKCSIWITPAKWQGKSDDCGRNMKFRRDIVPYMSKIISYRDTHDIFDIDYNDGISIYQIRKRKCHIKKIAGHCSKNSQFEYSYEDHDETVPVLLKRDLLQIIGKVGTLGEGFSQSYYVKNTDSGEPVIAGTLGFKRQTYTGEQDRGVDKALNQRYVLSINDKAYDVKPLDLGYVEVVQGEKGVCGFKKVDDLRSVNNLDKYKVIMSCMLGGGSNIFKEQERPGIQSYRVS